METKVKTEVKIKKKMKIAIGFFGITRSLKYTIDSINKNFFDVFKSNNIDYDIFIHSYILKSYKNNRTGEKITDSTKIDNIGSVLNWLEYSHFPSRY